MDGKPKTNIQWQRYIKWRKEIAIAVRKEFKGGATIRELAIRHGLSETSIRNIINYKTWKDVEEIT